MSELKEKIKEAVNKHLDTAIALSKDLAEHPELPYQEFESSRKMAEILKEAGFEVMDKIKISLSGNDVIEGIFRAHEADIKSEVLAEDVVYTETVGYVKEWKINSEKVTLGVEKISE